MSNEQNNNNDSFSQTGNTEQGAQVLPFRRRLKSLHANPQPTKKLKPLKTSKRTVRKDEKPLQPRLIQALQIALLVIAVVLTFQNCRTP